MSGVSRGQIEHALTQAKDSYGRGDFGGASAHVDAILAADPACVEAHLLRGMLLALQRRPHDAIKSFRRALIFAPELPEALSWAAITSLNLNLPADAEKYARHLAGIQPGNDRAHFLLANALCAQGLLVEGLSAIDHALELAPQEPDYIVSKAQILGRLNWASQAIEWYKLALAVRPTQELVIELAEVLMSEGQPLEAATLLEEFAAHLPEDRSGQVLRARVATEAQRFELAEKQWTIATRLATDHAALILERATSEIYAGRLEVAEGLLIAALEANPNAYRLYPTLVSIRKVSNSDLGLIEAMERVLAGNEVEPELRESLHYSLGKAYNDLGQFERAMFHYDEANRLAYLRSAPVNAFEPAGWEAYTDSLIAFFTKKRIASLARQGLESSLPIFIVGMIRSGTTLTEQVLSCHPDIQGGGETTFWPDHRSEVFDFQRRTFESAVADRLGRTYLEVLGSRARGSRYVTEKNPTNVFLSAMLHCVFPNAKFLHVKRQPVDNLLSIWMTPIKSGLPFLHHRGNLVFAYRQYQRLALHLEGVLPEDRFKTITYEEITSTPVSAADGMLSFLGLEPEPACYRPEANLRTVRTPSFYQVRQPINTHSQSRWKNYEPWLGSFAEFLPSKSSEKAPSQGS